MTDTLVIPSSSESLSNIQKLQERLNTAVSRRCNQVCSDCSEEHPTWASVLKPSFEGAKPLVALCCFRCCGHHVKLKSNVCVVKSPKMAADWTEEEVEALERSGNQIVKAIFEATLADQNKQEVAETQKKQDGNLGQYIREKYEKRAYFTEEAYRQVYSQDGIRHKRGSKGMRKKMSSSSPKPPSIRKRTFSPRSFSLDDTTELVAPDTRVGSPLMEQTSSTKTTGSDKPLLERTPSSRSGSSDRPLLERNHSSKSSRPDRPRLEERNHSSKSSRSGRPLLERNHSSKTGRSGRPLLERTQSSKTGRSGRPLLERNLSSKSGRYDRPLLKRNASGEAMEHRRDGLMRACSSRSLMKKTLSKESITSNEGADMSRLSSSLNKESDFLMSSDHSKEKRSVRSRVQRVSSRSERQSPRRTNLRRHNEKERSPSKSNTTEEDDASTTQENSVVLNKQEKSRRKLENIPSKRGPRRTDKLAVRSSPATESTSDATEKHEDTNGTSPTAVKDIAFIPDDYEKPRRKVTRSQSKLGSKRSNADRLAGRSTSPRKPTDAKGPSPDNLGYEDPAKSCLDEGPKQDRVGERERQTRPRGRGSVGGATTVTRRRAGSVGGTDLRHRGSRGMPVETILQLSSFSEDPLKGVTTHTCTTIDRIQARRREGGTRRRPARRMSASGAYTSGQRLGEVAVQRRMSLGSSEIKADSDDVEVPTAEDLVRCDDDDDTSNDEHQGGEEKKKSKSWKKKIAKLVKKRPGSSNVPSKDAKSPLDDAASMGSQAAIAA